MKKIKYNYKHEYKEAGVLASCLAVEPADWMIGRILLELGETDIPFMDTDEDRKAATRMAEYFLGKKRYKAFKKEFTRERGES